MAPGNLPRDPVDEILTMRMRPPDSVLYTRLGLRAAFIRGLLWAVAGCAAIALFVTATVTDMTWLNGLALLVVIGGGMLVLRYENHERPIQQRRDEARADELLESPDLRLSLRRRLAPGAAICWSLLCAIFTFIATQSDFPVPIAIGAVVLGAASVLAWWMALRSVRPIGAISIDGISIGEIRLGWDAIESIRGEIPWRVGRTRAGPRIRVTLFDRQSARRFAGAAGVSMLDQDEDAQFLLAIDSDRETSSVIYQVAQELWSRPRREKARAEGQREAARIHERLAAHPEEKEAIAREHQQQFDQWMADSRAKIDELKRRQAELSSPNRRRQSAWLARDDALRLSSRAQWTVVAVVAVIAAGVIFGLETPFFQSAEWQTASVFVVLGLAAILCTWAMIRLLPRAKPEKRVLVALGTVMIVLASCWHIMTSTLPDLYTRIAGRPYVEVAELRREQLRSGRGCQYRLRGAAFELRGHSYYFCVSQREFERLPEHGPMRLHGRETWFGRRIDYVTMDLP